VARLVAEGFTVFDVRHGSAPRFVLPEVVDDVRRAVRYVRTAGPGYGLDPNRLGAWGGSAGGHLAPMLATASESDPIQDDDAPVAPAAPLAAVVAFYPPTDLTGDDSTALAWAREQGRELTEGGDALGLDSPPPLHHSLAEFP
jgi:acetyl esterase/lipase